MIKVVLLSLLGFLFVSDEVQLTEITWTQLADVTFSSKFLPEEELYFEKPKFGPAIKDLNGKEIYITGHIMPIDPVDNYYVLSKNTFESCFFCGLAGAETVIELELLWNEKFEMDERVTMKGYLELNDDDPYKLTYVLQEAETYKK